MIYLRKFIEEKLINKKKNFFNKYTFMGVYSKLNIIIIIINFRITDTKKIADLDHF